MVGEGGGRAVPAGQGMAIRMEVASLLFPILREGRKAEEKEVEKIRNETAIIVTLLYLHHLHLIIIIIIIIIPMAPTTIGTTLTLVLAIITTTVILLIIILTIIITTIQTIRP